MNQNPSCCDRGFAMYTFKNWRGLCDHCEAKLRNHRIKEHTLGSAMTVAHEQVEWNLVGAMRLMAWALRMEAPYASDLRFEQGPAACAALLRP